MRGDKRRRKVKEGARKELKRTWVASCPEEKEAASRRAPSNASALCGACRNMTVEENLRAEEEVSVKRHRKTECPIEFTMIKTFIGEGRGVE